MQGWELIEEVIMDFENQMKEAVNEEHEGKRKCELTWKVHRIHWEKNRFIYDLMYVRKVMSRELVSLFFPESLIQRAGSNQAALRSAAMVMQLALAENSEMLLMFEAAKAVTRIPVRERGTIAHSDVVVI